MKKNLFMFCVSALFVFALSSCNSKKAEQSSETEKDSVEVESFNYTPAEPVNGKKKAIVELGASGFNQFIIEVDQDKNWKVLKKEFGSSLVAEGMTDAATIKAKLQDYIQSILNFGVEGKNIHFVVSSGAKKEKLTDDIIASLKGIGYVVNTVSPEQEAKCAFRNALPKGYEDKAFVVDLGSGNTKVSYMKDGQIQTMETFGAKYFEKDTDDKTAYEDVKKQLSAIPTANCETLFLIGGVPFKMAKSQKKGDERFTILSTTISDYDALVKEEGDKMRCGMNIYKAILDATDVKQVVFDWDANFAIGVLLDMPY